MYIIKDNEFKFIQAIDFTNGVKTTRNLRESIIFTDTETAKQLIKKFKKYLDNDNYKIYEINFDEVE